MALLARRSTYTDVRMRYLGVWLLYGLAFFSASQNKLAGYLLPLMPGLALLLAVGIDQAIEKSKIAAWLLAASMASLIVLPTVVGALPDAMLSGVGADAISTWSWECHSCWSAAVVWWLSWSGKPSLAMLAGGMAVVFGVAVFQRRGFPELDDRVSVRGFWRAHGPEAAWRCLEGVGRSWEYGLNYYAGRPFHACSPGETPRIVVAGD